MKSNRKSKKIDFSIIVNPAKVMSDGMKIKFNRISDLISYKEFVSYFKALNEIKKHNLIIGINFTYGWMPTIFEFTSEETNSVLKILNSAKSGKIISNSDMLVLKSHFNNSLVGSSKLLHFINPKVYAIWDSRVYNYLTKQKPYNSRVNNVDSYLKYLDWMRALIKHKDFPKLKNHIQSQVKYKMSDFRIAELVLYSFGKTK